MLGGVCVCARAGEANTTCVTSVVSDGLSFWIIWCNKRTSLGSSAGAEIRYGRIDPFLSSFDYLCCVGGIMETRELVEG